MAKIFKPSQKVLFVLVLILLLGMLGIYAIHVNLEGNNQVIFLSVVGTIIGLILAYVIYGYSRLVYLYLKSINGIKNYVKELRRSQRLRILSGASWAALITVILAIYEWALAVAFKRIFLLSISAIYVFLAAGRLYLILREDKIESRKSDFDLILGGIIFLTGIAVAYVSVLVYHDEGAFDRRGLLIYAIAAYSSYLFIWTIISTVKARKNKNFYKQTFLRLTQVKAIYTVFTLTVSMLVAFGISDESLYKEGIIALGAAVTFFILLYSAYLFYKGIRIRNGEQKEESNLSSNDDKIDEENNFEKEN